jgi:four helix bundle protein
MPEETNVERKEFAKDLEKRTRKFAVKIICLSTALPDTTEGKVIRNQITKSGTSVGAHYREANPIEKSGGF